MAMSHSGKTILEGLRAQAKTSFEYVTGNTGLLVWVKVDGILAYEAWKGAY